MAAFRILDGENNTPIAGAVLNGAEKTNQMGTATIRVNPGSTVVIRANGYVPHTEEIDMPHVAEQTIRLRHAVSLAGRVRDDRGAPVHEAELFFFEPDSPRAFLPGSLTPSSVTAGPATARTDADGRWTCQDVPADIDGVHIVVHHADHAAAFYSTAPELLDARHPGDFSDGRVRPISWAKLRSGQAEFVMSTGLPVVGTVLDPAGKPVVGATVRLNSIGVLDEYRGEFRTNPDGRFEFHNGLAGAAAVSAQADGYVMQTRQIEVSRAMPDIRIPMARGQLLSGRVIDEKGWAVAGADVTILTRDARIPVTGRTRLQTDEDGRFFWESAPEEPITVHVRADNHPETDELVEARARQNLIQLRSYRQIQLTGKVVDSQTGQPVPQFEVLTSTTRSRRPDDGWIPYRKAATGADGSFALTLYDSFPPNGTVVQPAGDGQKILRYVISIKIQAAGYFPDASQTVAIENGDASLAVSLVRGEGVSGTVTLPTGEPVQGARVVLCGRLGVVMERRGQLTIVSDETLETETDQSGRFQFAPQRDTRAVIAVHEKGFGLVTADKLAAPATVVLAPWARIDGTLRSGSRPVPYASIALGSPSATNRDVVTLALTAHTDDEGRFLFTRVPPGKHDFQRWQRVAQRSSAVLKLGTIEVQAGATHPVQLGGTGRPLIGRIVPAGARAPMGWTERLHALEAVTPKSPDSAEGRVWVKLLPDGSFRVEDVPAGTYRLKLNIPGLANNGFVREVVVPEMPGGRSDQPLDLGVIRIK